MRLFIIIFLFGVLYVQSFASLPSNSLVFSLILFTLILWIAFSKLYPTAAYLPLAFALGLGWCVWYANIALSWSLAKEVENQAMQVTGYIASLPVNDAFGTNFIFALEHPSTMIQLTWPNPQHPSLKVGDKWQFRVRLKRIHGLQNPGTFDYEAWALQKGLRAKGYVLEDAPPIFLAHAWYRFPINQLRQRLYHKIEHYLPQSPTAAWLMALMMGERSGIPSDQWQVLRNTGTNHLMAIAGLHIGIMAGFAHTMVAYLWRSIAFLPLWIPASQAGACAALITALLYSTLAGFSLPTIRACMMLAIFIFTLLNRRKVNSWNSWSLALLIVLLLNPLSVLSESFWLSFGTIALIIYGMRGRLAPSGIWWKWGRVQWVIGFGLIPLSLALFQECSLVSFVANSVCIPWLGFFILPFCLLSVVFLFIFPALAKLLLIIADKSLAGLWCLLTWFSHLHFASWSHAIMHGSILLTSIIGILLLLLPRGFPLRCLGFVWLAPLFLYKAVTPQLGDFWLTLLDVGQGLSAIIQTKEHILIYDGGPKYNANMDMGQQVVVPYLRTLRQKEIDMLVISHGDNDHIGGAEAIIKSLSIHSLKTSVPKKLANLLPLIKEKKFYCYAGQSWQWDNVTFTFLHPTKTQFNLGNDSSCVLRIENAHQRLLLTGDIEKNAEKSLIKRKRKQLPANVLVAPHHGSKTSGLLEFVEAVRPQSVLYATGYQNRYHFPHPTVMKTYEDLHAHQLNTAETGAIHIEFGEKPSAPELYRIVHKRYWMP